MTKKRVKSVSILIAPGALSRLSCVGRDIFFYLSIFYYIYTREGMEIDGQEGIDEQKHVLPLSTHDRRDTRPVTDNVKRDQSREGGQDRFYIPQSSKTLVGMLRENCNHFLESAIDSQREGESLR